MIDALDVIFTYYSFLVNKIALQMIHVTSHGSKYCCNLKGKHNEKEKKLRENSFIKPPNTPSTEKFSLEGRY